MYILAKIEKKRTEAQHEKANEKKRYLILRTTVCCL